MPDRERLVHALGPELADWLGPRMETRALNDGEHLIDAGVPSPVLYVLVQGALVVQRTRPTGKIELGTLRPGSLIGEVGFLDAGPATATLVARGRTRVLGIGREALPELQKAHPALAGQLLRRISETMAARLDDTSKAVLDHSPTERPPTRRARLRRLFGQLLGAS